MNAKITNNKILFPGPPLNLSFLEGDDAVGTTKFSKSVDILTHVSDQRFLVVFLWIK